MSQTAEAAAMVRGRSELGPPLLRSSTQSRAPTLRLSLISRPKISQHPCSLYQVRMWLRPS